MNHTQYLLLKLIEECGEVIVEAGKVMQFGYESGHPKYEGTNRERLHAELNDVAATIELLNGCGLRYEFDREAVETKKVKVQHYRKVAQECGGVKS